MCVCVIRNDSFSCIFIASSTKILIQLNCLFVLDNFLYVLLYWAYEMRANQRNTPKRAEFSRNRPGILEKKLAANSTKLAKNGEQNNQK